MVTVLGSGISPEEVLGCTEEWADNYSDEATEDNGSCYREGCIYDIFYNYDSLATDEDGSCYEFIYGCTDSIACNFIALTNNPHIDVNTDDGSCIFASDLDACATCSGETDGSGTIVDNDQDDDTYCDSIDAFPNDPTEWLIQMEMGWEIMLICYQDVQMKQHVITILHRH